MQLLPQAKVKELKHDERETEVFRKLRVSKTIAKEEKEIAEIVKNFEPEKRKKQKEFQEFHQHIEKRKSQLLGEIMALETKRDNAMQPYYELKFAAKEAMKVVQETEAAVRAEAKRVNTLHTTLKAVEEEQKQKAELLSEKEQKIARMEIDAIEREAKLEKEEALFVEKKKDFEDLSSRRESELDVKDRDLKAREATLEAKEENLVTREQVLANDRKHFASQQATLTLAFEEARKKGIL